MVHEQLLGIWRGSPDLPALDLALQIEVSVQPLVAPSAAPAKPRRLPLSVIAVFATAYVNGPQRVAIAMKRS